MPRFRQRRNPHTTTSSLLPLWSPRGAVNRCCMRARTPNARSRPERRGEARWTLPCARSTAASTARAPTSAGASRSCSAWSASSRSRPRRSHPGLTLRAHQVDALAGMLAALIGDFERGEEDDQDDEPDDEADADDGDVDAEEIEDEARTRTRTTTPNPSATRMKRPIPTISPPTPRSPPRRRRPIPARAGATASSIRPHRARPWPPPASSMPAARPAC